MRRVRFHRTKYGRELLVDAARLREMPGFDFSDRPYLLDGHDLLLVTAGRGTFALDDRVYPVAPRSLVFTRAGEVRRLAVPGLDGACVFFAEEFVSAAFADARFLERFACLAPGRPSAVLRLDRPRRTRFLTRFAEMQAEIRSLRDDAPDALRAKLYDLLVEVDRWYVAAFGPVRGASGLVQRFQSLLESGHAREHRVEAYARRLGVSPGHLSALCRAHLGQGAGACVRARVVLEARRLLLHTQLPVSEIADRLGFDDPAYFARYVRRETGLAPSVLRSRGAMPASARGDRGPRPGRRWFSRDNG